ncbi:Serine acetyltransferase [Peribacillus frigoritolerans]|uniref:serine O-acetyltransferase n=1 Tax=Peribacillus frigoritolerans TaxID=450367 RepID=UPI0030D15396
MFYKIIYIGRWAYKQKFPIVPGLMTKILRLIYSCDIPCYMDIPKSVRFAHKGLGVAINQGTRIGENVFIQQGVTLGKKEKDGGCPTILNNVYIGTGAIILGDIVIGENSNIGAGSVVINDVPPNSTCVGVPGKIVRGRAK